MARQNFVFFFQVREREREKERNRIAGVSTNELQLLLLLLLSNLSFVSLSMVTTSILISFLPFSNTNLKHNRLLSSLFIHSCFFIISLSLSLLPLFLSPSLITERMFKFVKLQQNSLKVEVILFFSFFSTSLSLSLSYKILSLSFSLSLSLILFENIITPKTQLNSFTNSIDLSPLFSLSLLLSMLKHSFSLSHSPSPKK